MPALKEPSLIIAAVPLWIDHARAVSLSNDLALRIAQVWLGGSLQSLVLRLMGSEIAGARTLSVPVW